MTKRVVVCCSKASQGWWKPDHVANNEPHFGDTFLKVSRKSRGRPRYQIEWFFIKQVEWYRGLVKHPSLFLRKRDGCFYFWEGKKWWIIKML